MFLSYRITKYFKCIRGRNKTQTEACWEPLDYRTMTSFTEFYSFFKSKGWLYLEVLILSMPRWLQRAVSAVCYKLIQSGFGIDLRDPNRKSCHAWKSCLLLAKHVRIRKIADTCQQNVRLLKTLLDFTTFWTGLTACKQTVSLPKT
jgi:hypothetical protein